MYIDIYMEIMNKSEKISKKNRLQNLKWKYGSHYRKKKK